MKYIDCAPRVLLALCVLITIACRPGHVGGYPGPAQPTVGGTIAGIVSTENKVPVPNRNGGAEGEMPT